MNVASLITFLAGVVLVYSGVKKLDPRIVLRNALTGKSGAENAALSTPTDSGSATIYPTSNIPYPSV